jgi:hypothetical protein
MLVAGLGVLALPVLLLILKRQPVEGYSVGSFTRLSTDGPAMVTDGGTLLSYVMGRLPQWLGAPVVGQWFWISLLTTCGLIVLRPHLAALGIVTTLISWLMKQDLLWAPRLAHALALGQVAGCLALASAWQLWTRAARPEGGRRWLAGAAVVAVAVMLGIVAQWRTVPTSSEVYTLRPKARLGAAERAEADRVFAIYREWSKREEPVIASPYLFRYAHDRNLLWFDRLDGRPVPEWILWDKQERVRGEIWVGLKASTGLGPDDYQLVKRSSRFLLFRRWPMGHTPAIPRSRVEVGGESDGQIGLRVRFPVRFTGAVEPLLSMGKPEQGQLFFVRYLDDERLVLGFHQPGAEPRESEPLAYHGEKTVELGFFCGALLPDQDDEGGAAGLARWHHRNLVRVTCDGREVLNALVVLPREAGSGIVVGENSTGVLGVWPRFTGEVLAAWRGGYPALPPGVALDRGALRLILDLPGTNAGVPEPLVVVGEPGRASLAYLRLLPGKRAQVGVEFWGHGVSESAPFALPNPSRAEVVVELPAFFPPEGDASWGGVSRAWQEGQRRRCRVLVNGEVRLDVPAQGPMPSQEIHLGINPLGGSFVTQRFTGTLLQAVREPLERIEPGERK